MCSAAPAAPDVSSADGLAGDVDDAEDEDDDDSGGSDEPDKVAGTSETRLATWQEMSKWLAVPMKTRAT